MDSTVRWNRSAALTTKQKRTPRAKQRGGGAARAAWLPAWWVSAAAPPPLMKVSLRIRKKEAHLWALCLSFRTPSRASRWFCFRISTPSSHPAPLTGKKAPVLCSKVLKRRCIKTFNGSVSFVLTRVIKMWDLRKNYTAHHHDPVPLQTYPYPGSCMRMRLGQCRTMLSVVFIPEICKRPAWADLLFLHVLQVIPVWFSTPADLTSCVTAPMITSTCSMSAE